MTGWAWILNHVQDEADLRLAMTGWAWILNQVQDEADLRLAMTGMGSFASIVITSFADRDACFQSRCQKAKRRDL